MGEVSTSALIWILLEETLWGSGHPPQQSQDIWQEQSSAIMLKSSHRKSLMCTHGEYSKSLFGS